MSRFHVGQRVRILRLDVTDPRKLANVGAIGTIIELNVQRNFLNHRVRLDNGYKNLDGFDPLYFPFRLEPLEDYDGNTQSTWEQCIWKPKQVNV